MAYGSVTGTQAVTGNRPSRPSVAPLKRRRTLSAALQPPPAYYDPAIDSQVAASRRGLAQLLADNSLARVRGENDYNTARGDIFRQRDEGLADLLTGFQRGNTQFDWQQQDYDTGYNRGISDLDTGFGRYMDDSRLGEGRLREDYGTAVGSLQRSYRQLAGRQAQGASAAGVGAGGAFAQAAAKRAQNEAIDRQPLDTNFNRGLADLLTDRTRTTQDYGTNRGRLTEDYQTNTGRLGTQRGWTQQDYDTNVQRTNQAADRGAGQLDLSWQRQVQDWGRQEQRATNETGIFGQDANQQRWFQARQAGYVAPTPPRASRRRGR